MEDQTSRRSSDSSGCQSRGIAKTLNRSAESGSDRSRAQACSLKGIELGVARFANVAEFRDRAVDWDERVSP